MTDRKERTEEVRTFEFRAADGGDGQTLEGYAAVYDTWAEIRDAVGSFRERIRPQAFKRALNIRTPVMQFDHGQHPLVGSIPIGTYSVAREDRNGMFVRGRLADNWLVEPVRDAIRDGAITGMSIRMKVVKDEWGTDENGVETRDIIEGEVLEAGPVVWPAYTTTSVAVRSLAAALDDNTRAELAKELAPAEDAPLDVVELPPGEALALVNRYMDENPDDEKVVELRAALEALRLTATDFCTPVVAAGPATDDSPAEPPVASHEANRELIAATLAEFRHQTPQEKKSNGD